MKVEDLVRLMSGQRTVRRFKPDPVPEGHLRKILEAARWAPSAANTQPWDLVVVKDHKLKEKIAEIYADALRAARSEDKRFPYDNPDGLYERFTKPPVLIAVCADTRFRKAYPKAGDRKRNLYISMGLAIQNMMLAANALGLGLSWGTTNSFSREKLSRLLRVPASHQVIEVLQLGYPVEQMPPRFRRDTSDFTHRDKFDRSKLRSDEEIRNLIRTRKSADIYSGSNHSPSRTRCS